MPVPSRPAERPRRSRGAFSRLGPFAVAGALALSVLPVAGELDWGEAGVAALLLAALFAVALVVPRLADGPGAHWLGLGWLVPLALLREATGGAGGGYGLLVLIPVLWVALHGRRGQLGLVLGGVAVLVFAPLLIAHDWSSVGWRSGPILLLLCTCVGVLVQQLLARERLGAARRRRLLQVLADGVIVTDVKGLVLEVNAALCAITGYAADELVGQRAPLPSWPVEDHAALLLWHVEAIQAGGGELETRLVRKDGSDVHVLVNLAVVDDDEQDRRTVIATVKDITERVRLQLELQAERDRSRVIVENMSEGLGLTRDGRIVEANPALCEITGFSREELIGAPLPFPFWPPESVEELKALRDRILEDRGGTYETTFMRKDGTRFPTEAVTTPLFDAKGRHDGFLNTFRDITDRKRAEEALMERSRGLEALAGVTRAVAHADPAEARRTVCDLALEISGANTATIWEAGSDGLLHNRCIVGAPTPPFSLGPADDEIGARRVYRTREPLFIADASRSPHADPRMIEILGCASGHFQPILEGDQVLGVLGLSWREPLSGLTMAQAELVALLAHEAAVAIARASSHAELEHLAQTDALTGLANRRALEERFAQAAAAAAADGQPVTLAVIDLDHFKAFNDTYGHPRGDALLRAVSDAWSDRLRGDTDVLARWGGEEFCLLLIDCDVAAADKVVGQLRGVVPDDQTFSAGVAAWQPGMSFETLTATADRALYAAKREGRNRTVVAPDVFATTAAAAAIPARPAASLPLPSGRPRP